MMFGCEMWDRVMGWAGAVWFDGVSLWEEYVVSLWTSFVLAASERMEVQGLRMCVCLPALGYSIRPWLLSLCLAIFVWWPDVVFLL